MTASSASELRAASRALAGDHSARLSGVSAAITRALAELEARIDFADEDPATERAAGLAPELAGIAARLRDEAGRSRSAGASPERVRVAIVGAPNAGKSTLANRLAGREAALVSAAPGTTVDTVECDCDLAGVPVTLMDTAGIAGTGAGEGQLARLAAAASLRFMATAQIALVVVDSAAPDLPDELARALAGSRGAVFLVLAKSDLAPAGDAAAVALERLERPGAGAAWTGALSAVTGEGVDDLTSELARRFRTGELRLGAEGVTLGAASAAALASAAASVEAAAEALGRGADEIAAFELREAASAVGVVTGEGRPYELADSVLDELFERFCVGK